MGFFGESRYEEEKSRRLEEMLPYRLNREVLRGHDSYIMHDMPIHARKSS